jgi:alpha-tubulin suppressor-like RCC1 family protein
LGNLYGAQVPNIDLLKFERIKLPTKIAKISTGSNHIVALAESKKVFSWGVGSSG